MRHIYLLLTFLCLAVCTSVTLADGVYIPKVAADNDTADLSEPVQRAVIFHDGMYERLILQVSFRGSVSEFAWLVPTPSKPDIGEDEPNDSYSNSKELFENLHQTTAPRIRYWFNADDSLRLHARGGSDKPHASNVDVIERKVVGDYDVAVLRAKNASDLLDWLRKHGYQTPRKLKPVLADYIQRGWVFTATRINTASYGKIKEGMLEPLRLQFASKDPIYPLKISSLNPGRTKVILYVITSKFVSAPGFSTICAVNNKTPDRDHSIYMVRRYDMHDWYSYPSNEQNARKANIAEHRNQPHTHPGSTFIEMSYNITKLTADLTSEQMKKDVLLLPAKSQKPFEPKSVPPPLLANIGAVILLGVGRFFGSWIPYSMSLFCFVMAAVRAFNGHDARRWVYAALILLLGGIPLGIVILLQDLGFALVGLLAVAAPPLLLVRWHYRRTLDKARALKSLRQP